MHIIGNSHPSIKQTLVKGLYTCLMDSVQQSYKKGTLLSSLYTLRNIYLKVINFKLTSTSFCQVLLKFNLIVFLCARMKQEEEKKKEGNRKTEIQLQPKYSLAV